MGSDMKCKTVSVLTPSPPNNHNVVGLNMDDDDNRKVIAEIMVRILAPVQNIRLVLNSLSRT